MIFCSFDISTALTFPSGPAEGITKALASLYRVHSKCIHPLDVKNREGGGADKSVDGVPPSRNLNSS